MKRSSGSVCHYTESGFRLLRDMSETLPTATTEPRAMRADAVRNRAKIVEAGRAAFGERGLETQMEDVARRAGVGVGTVYRHFPTKDELVRALIVDKMERLAAKALEALEAPDADPWESFASVLYHGAQSQLTDRSLAQVLASMPQCTWREAAEEETRLGERMAALLGRAQQAGVVRPDVRPDDIPLVMCGLGAVVQNDRSWERYMQLVLDGFRARGPERLPD
jgi:AcrR family transcriptional regulator